ncbi:MAG: DUF6174 domain-containing protein [Calditrichia bacterium]
MRQQTIGMLFKTLIIALLGISFNGCGLFNSNDRSELDEQLAKWQSFNLSNYSYEFRASCFCFPEFNEWVSVTVKDDTISSVTILSTTEPPQELPLNNWFTIDDLFETVSTAVETADEFEISYNDEYGYPEVISVDYIEEAVDDEVTYNSINLTIDE